MARQPLVKVTCDRCPKTFETAVDAPSEDGVLIDAKGLGLGEIIFEDLCQKCRKRVADLIALIAKVDRNDEKDSPAESTPSREAGQIEPPQDGGQTMKNEGKFAAEPEDEGKNHEEPEEEKEKEEDDDDSEDRNE
jgi:hypothetical protein